MRQDLPRPLIRLFLLLILSACLIPSSLAQDPVFGLYFAQKMYVNPAFTGYDKGVVFSSGMRDQWYRIGGSDAIFRTYNLELGIDASQINSGFGFQYLNSQAGSSPDSKIGWNRASFSYAFRLRDCYGRPRKFEFSLGLRASYNYYNLVSDNFRFPSQLDPLMPGILGPSPLGPLNDLIGSSVDFFDLDAGALLRISGLGLGKTRGDQLLFGFAGHHIPGRMGFLELQPQRTFRGTFHLSYGRGELRKGGRQKLTGMFRSDMEFATAYFRPQGFTSWSNQLGAVWTIRESVSTSNKREYWLGAWGQGRVMPNGANRGLDPDNPDNRFETQASIYTAILSMGMKADLPGNSRLWSQSFRLGFSYSFRLNGVINGGGRSIEAFLIWQFPNATRCNCYVPFNS